MARKYEEVWTRLKQRDRVRLIVKPLVYATVKAGIIKEKNRDMAFKIMNDNGEQFKLKFDFHREDHILYIELVQPLGIAEKVVT